MTDNQDLKEAIEENSKTRRGVLNPLLWMGLCAKFFGILLCVTIIGFPWGMATIEFGDMLMYKNREHSSFNR